MPKVSEDLVALGFENVEAVVKHIVDSDSLASDLPYVSSAIKLISLRQSISDRILGSKLAKFFDALHRVPDEERDRMYERLLKSDESARRVGEVMLLTIERLNGLDKPKWTALALVGYLDEALTFDELRRVMSSIEQTIPPDLEFLVAKAAEAPSQKAAVLAAFVPSGLAAISAAATWDDDGVMLYGVSELGRKFAGVYRKWRLIVS